MPHSGSTNSSNSRVSKERIEISERLAWLETHSRHSDMRFDKLESQLNQISNKLDNNTKPQWSVMIAFAGLLLVLLEGWSRGPIEKLGRQDAQIAAIQEDLTMHIAAPGHPASMERLRLLEGSMDAERQSINKLMELLQEVRHAVSTAPKK